MTPPAWPHPQQEVAYFRDEHGTCFAAEIVRAPRWSGALLAPPDEVVADIRIAFLERAAVPPVVVRPRWLAVLAEGEEHEPAAVVRAAQQAWLDSPSYREPGAAPEEYVVAGFQALCPPHPPCDPNPAARESLSRFLRERPGILGSVGELGRDGFNRAVRLYWPTPAAFAEAILCERMRDEGAGSLLDLAGFLRDATVATDGTDAFCALAVTREAILLRLHPERFFTHASDFDRAVEEARRWRERYEHAYRTHYREVYEAAQAALEDSAAALRASSELDALNRRGRAVGEDSVHRLVRAATALRALPPEPEEGLPITADVVLGQGLEALAESRLASAAVLAALEVHRRRAAMSIVPATGARRPE